MINETNGGEKSFVPKPDRERGVGEKGNTRLDDVSVFPFGDAVLLRCMWASQTVLDTSMIKETCKAMIFATAIGLNSTIFGRQ